MEINVDKAIEQLLAQQESNQGIGTKATGFATADLGPFRCDHCTHAHEESTRCDHPEVQADPEVPKDEKGRAIIAPDDCCNEFHNKSKAFKALEAGIEELLFNYKLEGRTTFQGLDISIENDVGSLRKGIDPDGKPWETKMTHAYGYIRMTEGVDGDHVDCFLGPDEDAKFAYIVHVNNPKTGKFDEDKCMLGFSTRFQAMKAFTQNYNSIKFFGSMKAIPMATFKEKALGTKGHPRMLSYGTSEGVKKEWDTRGRGTKTFEFTMNEAAHEWTDGYVRGIQEAADDLIRHQTSQGLGKQNYWAADRILDGIRNAEPLKVPLYRGLSVYGLNDSDDPADVERRKRFEQLRNLKEGDEFQITQPQSFSKDDHVARQFASRGVKYADKIQQSGIMFKINDGAQGIDVNKVIGESATFSEEKEVITNGRFKVLEVDASDPYVREITVKQLGVL